MYACGMSEIFHWIGEGERKEREPTKGKEFLVNRVQIRMEFRTKIKNPIK